jgi:hypothetical protein
MKRIAKQNPPVSLIADCLPPLTNFMIPRITDMRDGTFRPEVVLKNDVHFGRPVSTMTEAHRLAVAACEKGVQAAVDALSVA